jgi:hypothetical protein
MEIAAGFRTSRTRSKLKRKITSRDPRPRVDKSWTEPRTALPPRASIKSTPSFSTLTRVNRLKISNRTAVAQVQCDRCGDSDRNRRNDPAECALEATQLGRVHRFSSRGSENSETSAGPLGVAKGPTNINTLYIPLYHSRAIDFIFACYIQFCNKDLRYGNQVYENHGYKTHRHKDYYDEIPSAYYVSMSAF